MFHKTRSSDQGFPHVHLSWTIGLVVCFFAFVHEGRVPATHFPCPRQKETPPPPPDVGLTGPGPLGRMAQPRFWFRGAFGHEEHLLRGRVRRDEAKALLQRRHGAWSPRRRTGDELGALPWGSRRLVEKSVQGASRWNEFRDMCVRGMIKA